MDALEDELHVAPGDVEDPLHAEDVGPALAEELADPRLQLHLVEGAVEGEAHRSDGAVVDVAGVVEEHRVDGEGAAEIEGAEAHHLVDGQLGVAGGVDLGEAVERVDPRLDGGELGGGDQVDLVEEDDVGEGDLLLALGAVVEVEEDVPGVDDGDEPSSAVCAFTSSSTKKVWQHRRRDRRARWSR